MAAVLLALFWAAQASGSRFCSELPSSPGGCPGTSGGACYSSNTEVVWACLPEGADIGCASMKLPLPEEGNYQGFCTFDAAVKSSGTAAPNSTAAVNSANSPTAFNFSAPPPDSPVAEHGRLTVVGTKLLGEHGDPVQLRGMSLFWSQWGQAYWNEDVVDWLRTDWKISLLRAAMGVESGGYLENSEEEKRKLVQVVEAATRKGIYVIIDWHDHAALDHREEAKAFFAEMAQIYGHLPNVLFETFNEPLQVDWSQHLKPYHQEILATIRQYSNNLVICGTPTWSQDVDRASEDQLEGENIAYTLHFYASTHKGYLREKASTALQNGAALFVTEWGTCEASGDGSLDFVETQAWLDFLDEHHISDAAWAVNDKAEACSALMPGASSMGNWADADLTESGRWVRNSLREDEGSRRLGGITISGAFCQKLWLVAVMIVAAAFL
eukprot:CAMPEP_0197655270 /NCGR_PEP_ID=MMETSP1338-20131121/39353_1 /TAXON_ID=43686 ORGANISM="Pelagodinium beii, Strain RCC1491" /NCGR_SAMPLE_ID=MMETSP1338 /ASSEMBLY_ACC=CAM_ASM_000754 /LENGTH=439 /DNA_ID=CAMNT_0043230891 /DNA_START=60 /DNA_END=1379 /DNA_ORIENTATION=+